MWAARSSLTTAQLKHELRKTLEETDRILVVEVNGEWADRRAEKQSRRIDSAARRSCPLPLGEAMGKEVIRIATIGRLETQTGSLVLLMMPAACV